jgi:fatty-acid desaturase
MNTSYRQHFFFVICAQLIFGLIAIADIVINGASIWLVATFLMWFLMYVMGEGIFLHRYFSHRAFETHEWIAKTFAVFAILGGFGGPIGYRATHTGLHHAFSDTDRDPHTPTKGWWYAMVGWHLTNHKLPLIICKHLLKDPFYVKLESNIIAFWWATFIIFALIDVRLALYGLGLAGIIGSLFTAWTNASGHSIGTQRFNNRDNSKNIAWWSWVCWQGSGALQNNHHAHPARYHDSWAWYEFDIGRWIIPLIATKINQNTRSQV